MNRFRGRKKAKDDMVAAPRPSVESESSGPFKMFGKKKSVEEEPKPEVNLATALPSNDDFRTSLLMTNLSARFSMLREQDDPSTKVGKASDDSVLFPKRQSRMMDFGYGAGLSDIAEVESIKGPAYRVNSFVSTDDAASTSGSVMTRSKPTEGNNLFGGRQKIYKIPAGGSSKNGGLPGRALYEDDVAQSAFQKWRQAERERRSLEEDRKDDSLESEPARSESPSQPEYNRRRETSSTTSSGPSGARNSTAATSITSTQPSSSVKDWQSSTAPPSATSPAPPLERNVTRTRRLYEQSLNQDMHDHQSSALSRIDTLSKQRSFGTRTPDLTPIVPSPTTSAFSDRFANSRSILSKASAPNLRSFSPPTAPSSQMSPVEGNNKFTGLEPRTSFGATPPLSPPISETEEHTTLPIGPNDRGKATAMGVFTKPAAQYDETRYAQRQIQLQQGRETPTHRFRTESNASAPTSRSRSSSAHRTPFEKHDSASLKPEPTVQEEGQSSTFFDDDDDDEDDQSADSEPVRPEIPPQLTIERPNDHDHPAFRKSALPTPLSLSFKVSDGPATIAERSESSNTNSKNVSPEDSPTLGPTSGLSGMVRQHLRNDSNSSSVYDSQPNDTDLASRFPPERDDAQSLRQIGANSNPWESAGGDWAISVADGPSPTTSNIPIEPREPAPEPPTSIRDSESDVEEAKETDDFARHLADGARRVRERLTSYVESEPDTSTTPEVPEMPELPPPPRPNALGILKSKSSRGSLMDRKRGDKEGLSQLKAKKLLGFGSSTAPISPSARQTSFEMNDEPRKEDKTQTEETIGTDDRPISGEKEENVHAGLKAFRQARRELQRMKELETQARYKAEKASQEAEAASNASAGPQPGSRPPSTERRPPPITYNNRMPSDEPRTGPGSRSGSRAPSERDRSGSETSSGGRSGSRPARLRNGSIPYDEHHGPMGHPYGPNGMPRQNPMMRSPGMPGPDMKRSPHMPPQPYLGSPGRFNRSESAQNLTVAPFAAYEPGQPSPMSLKNGAPSPYGPGGMSSTRSQGQPHPNNMDPHHPSNRMMRTRDISEPSFSQAPAVQSDGSQGLRTRSGSIIGAAASTPNLHGNMSAPPVPPINPRRKNNMLGGFMRRSEDEMSLSSSHLPMSPVSADDGHGAFTSDDDERAGRFRQKLRKATSEAQGLNSRARSMRNSPPQPMNRPPLPPNMVNNNTMPGGYPGGMI
ncbi:Fc.00g043900.m01.CDS01 [Cosmosporella sp. VM-42]